MDFAPYQDTPPDLQRTLSPSPPPRRALSRSPPAQTQQSYQKPSYQQHQQQSSSSHLPLPSHFGADVEPNNSVYANNNINNNNNINSSRLTGRSHINLFETSLPIRLDYEAVAAYILLPPAGAVILLLLEHKSDYVR